MSSFFSLLIKLLRTKSLQSLRRSENCKLISRNWDKLHIRTGSCHSFHISNIVSNYLGIPFSHEYFWKAKIGLVIMTPPRSNITSFIISYFSANFCFSCKGQGNYVITWCTWRDGWRWSADAPNCICLKHFWIGLNEIANPLLCYIPHRKYRKMADELPDDFDVIVLGTGMLCDYRLFNVVNLMKQIYKLP